MMVPRTRYAKTPDGGYIAYKVLGEGPPDIAVVGQGGSSRIGNSSCNELSSCIFAGSFRRVSRIGNHSCNYDATFDVDRYVGACVVNDGTIGNNKFN
jgi:hypothetical protein